MSNKCECCGRGIESKQCGYCGFVSVTALDKAGETFNRKRVKEHKQMLLDSLKEVYVVAHKYHADAQGQVMELRDSVDLLVMTDSKALSNSYWNKDICWAPYNFGHQPLENDAVTFHLKLTFSNGIAKEQVCTMKPAEVSDFWKLGFAIGDDFGLRVYFGRPEQYVTGQYEINWPELV